MLCTDTMSIEIVARSVTGNMAKNSKIEWCDHTFNPWHGCTKVSPGCKNCYAEALTNRFAGKGFWGPEGERRFFGDKHWNEPLKWNRKAEKLGVRHKVFCGSMCDVFEDREDLIEPRTRLFNLINHTRQLDWLLLTKRPENILRMIERDAIGSFGDNVWLGTSVENQEQADIRIPELLKIPAKVRFLSCEPLLERVDIAQWVEPELQAFGGKGTSIFPRINWIIVGGESGPRKRHFDPDWARDIRDQCKEAGVPFFMKQINKVDPIPSDLLVREFPNV